MGKKIVSWYRLIKRIKIKPLCCKLPLFLCLQLLALCDLIVDPRKENDVVIKVITEKAGPILKLRFFFSVLEKLMSAGLSTKK